VIVNGQSIELALDSRCQLGEGPIWDDRVGRLLFVDIEGHEVHAFDPETGHDETIGAGGYVSAIALDAAGGWLAALQHDIARFTLAGGIGERIARIEGDRADTRLNDGYVDSRGRFWIGSLSLEKEIGQCALYRLERDPEYAARAAPRITPMLDRVTNSNGIDWSPDDRLMYYVDTGTRRIDVFDFDAVSGDIANRRALVTIDEADGKPDGLIVDADGCLWVALWQGSAVRRYTPDGRLDRQIDLPVSCPTKCAFGGPDLDMLYITSAHKALSMEQREREPHAGSLFAARPGVRGKPANRARFHAGPP